MKKKNRITDTAKWSDEWFCALSKENKLAWLFILDHCSDGGRWEKNFKLLNFFTESVFDEKLIEKVFDGRLIDMGNYYFIPKFLKFQYPKGLNGTVNSLVKTVRDELYKYNLHEIVNKMYGDKFMMLQKNDKVVDCEDVWIIKYIDTKLERVKKMHCPLTVEQAKKIEKMYNREDVINVLTQMDNYKPLLSKYVSVYLTLLKWLEISGAKKSGHFWTCTICKKNLYFKNREEYNNHILDCKKNVGN